MSPLTFTRTAKQLDFTAFHSVNEKQMFCTSGQLLSVHELISTGGSFGLRALVSPSLHESWDVLVYTKVIYRVCVILMI